MGEGDEDGDGRGGKTHAPVSSGNPVNSSEQSFPLGSAMPIELRNAVLGPTAAAQSPLRSASKRPPTVGVDRTFNATSGKRLAMKARWEVRLRTQAGRPREGRSARSETSFVGG